jgi:hypothetical protein
MRFGRAEAVPDARNTAEAIAIQVLNLAIEGPFQASGIVMRLCCGDGWPHRPYWRQHLEKSQLRLRLFWGKLDLENGNKSFMNSNDLELIRRHSGSDVSKRWPPTRSDWIFTGFIVGLFALGILYAVIQQHFA